MPPIAILADRSEVNYILINQLLEEFDVALVVFEQHTWVKRLQLLGRRRKRLGQWRVLQQSLFTLWDRIFLRPSSSEKVARLLAGHDITPPDGQVETLDMRDINAPEVVEKLHRVSPACVVVSGTSILRRPIIESAPVLLNLHCGITPRYRGVHGAFWAVYEGRPDLAGVTVHQIDAGIDTGTIVAQDTVELDTDDTYRTLPAKQYLKGIPLMIAAVRAALSGDLPIFNRTDLESKLWYTPTLLEYVKFCKQLQSYARSEQARIR